jgi:hypothetical protein
MIKDRQAWVKLAVGRTYDRVGNVSCLLSLKLELIQLIFFVFVSNQTL